MALMHKSIWMYLLWLFGTNSPTKSAKWILINIMHNKIFNNTTKRFIQDDALYGVVGDTIFFQSSNVVTAQLCLVLKSESILRTINKTSVNKVSEITIKTHIFFYYQTVFQITFVKTNHICHGPIRSRRLLGCKSFFSSYDNHKYALLTENAQMVIGRCQWKWNTCQRAVINKYNHKYVNIDARNLQRNLFNMLTLFLIQC